MVSLPKARSFSQLFGDSLAEMAKLIQNEVDLARAELGEKIETIGAAGKLIVAGGVLLIPALVLILLAISAELIQLGWSAPLAYLCSGVGAAIVAVALVLSGASRVSGNALKPSATLDEIQKDTFLAKELMR
jgi:hypothetical protein